MLKKIKNLLLYLSYTLSLHFNPLLKKQRKDPMSIPVLIINYNQLYFLKKQVEFYIKRGFQNIVIIDNQSTYPPLLEYYKELEKSVSVEFMNHNYGHKVFFESDNLQKKYGKGYYIITDADVVPNSNLPEDFMLQLIRYLDKYFRACIKVGFALRLDDIPDYYPLKQNVITWEHQFWKFEIDNNVFKADIDTTFALYKPGYPKKFNNLKFTKGFRIGGNFTAKHGGWYLDKDNLSDENKYYFKHCNHSSSWKFTEKGELTEELKGIY